jgi:hypothetical protein
MCLLENSLMEGAILMEGTNHPCENSPANVKDNHSYRKGKVID